MSCSPITRQETALVAGLRIDVAGRRLGQRAGNGADGLVLASIWSSL